MAKKGVAQKVRMESTGKREDGSPTGYRRWARVGKNMSEKLTKSMFDPWAWHAEKKKTGAHVKFEQKKMPPSKKN